MKCYQKAKCPHLESEAKAYSLAQQARAPGLKRNEIEDIYMEAAYAFLKCDASEHDYQCLENAAKCLKNAKKYRESSQLYVLLGQVSSPVQIIFVQNFKLTQYHFRMKRLSKATEKQEMLKVLPELKKEWVITMEPFGFCANTIESQML